MIMNDFIVHTTERRDGRIAITRVTGKEDR